MNIKQTILERLRLLGIQPSKGLGQNFLFAETVYEKILRAAELTKEDTVVEVGPGLGTLTEQLADSAARVIAIEKDRRMIDFLRSLFADKPSVEIIEADALEIATDQLPSGPYKVVANIPYYITSRLLRTIFEQWPRPSMIVLLVQHEVAQRIVAKPPKANLLGISIQYFTTPKIIAKVPATAFYPAPEVTSAIIQLVPKNIAINHDDIRSFFKVVKAGFAAKRKKLTNNLASNYGISKEQATEALLRAGVSENARPENLTLEQWQKLTDILSGQS